MSVLSDLLSELTTTEGKIHAEMVYTQEKIKSALGTRGCQYIRCTVSLIAGLILGWISKG